MPTQLSLKVSAHRHTTSLSDHINARNLLLFQLVKPLCNRACRHPKTLEGCHCQHKQVLMFSPDLLCRADLLSLNSNPPRHRLTRLRLCLGQVSERHSCRQIARHPSLHSVQGTTLSAHRCSVALILCRWHCLLSRSSLLGRFLTPTTLALLCS